jgi:O-antigen/teichoic acid export membrane protein
LSFIAGIILARILGPEEFGLIGMISVFIAIGNALVDSGLSTSIIRTKDADNSDYSTVFYLNIALSILVYVALFFLAPYVSQFYNQGILTLIIRIYCLSFIISALSSVQLVILNKEMQFRKMLLLNIPGTLIGIVIGIVMGYYGYGVWSIVWMYLGTQLIQSILLWVFSSWKPSFNFSKEKMKFHYGFGYKLMLSGLIDTVFKNIYNVLIGRYYPVQSLGYYERARAFNDYPVTAITGIISRVSYPLLAQLQNQKEQISRAYKQLLQLSFFILAPLMLGTAAIAKPLFLLVLGEQWLEAVPFFQILCLSGMFFPVHAFNINVLKVFGRSDLFLRLEIIKKTVMVISLLVAFQFGLIVLIWSNVFTSIVALWINMYYSSNLINYSAKRQLGDMLPTLVKAMFMAAIMYILLSLLGSLAFFLQILIVSMCGVSFYFILNYVLKSEPLFYMLTLIKDRKL